MDSFLRRLKFYGIGFGIGLVFVVFFFQNRGCSWLPSNRVKNSFLDRVIVLPDNQLDIMKTKKLTTKDIVNVLNDGEVVFSKSQTEGATKIYLLEKEFDGKGMVRFYFTMPNESFISEVHFSESNAKKVKNTETGFGSMIHFPNDANMVFVDTSKFTTCQQDALGLISPKEIFQLIQKSGKIDFSKTNFKIRPKAEHYIEFIDKKKRVVGAKAIWYKNKINITSFVVPFETDCK